MAVETVGIIGSGLMGTGIAQVCAASGLKVIVRDIDQAALARSAQSIADSLTKLVARQKLTEETRTAALAAISTTTDGSSRWRASHAVVTTSDVSGCRCADPATGQSAAKTAAAKMTNLVMGDGLEKSQRIV